MGLSELTGGDDVARAAVKMIQQAVGKVSQVTAMAVAQAERLKADDTMNPAGKARLLDELPNNLEAGTYALHSNVESAIAVLEARLTSVALAHDSTPAADAAIRDELSHYVAAIKPTDAHLTLVQLAANSRYSTMLAGPYGESLAARFQIDPASLKRAALQTVAQSGTPTQKAAAAGLGKLHKATRVHALSKAGTQNAVRSIRESKQTQREQRPQ